MHLEHVADIALPVTVLNQTNLTPVSTREGWIFQAFRPSTVGGGGPSVFRWKRGMQVAEEVGRLANCARGDIAPSWDGSIYALNHDAAGLHRRIAIHRVVGVASPVLATAEAGPAPLVDVAALVAEVQALRAQVGALEVRLANAGQALLV